MKIALRLALRNLSRSRKQNVLVVAIVALAFAAATVLTTLSESAIPTKQELVQHYLGTTSARFELQGSPGKGNYQAPDSLGLMQGLGEPSKSEPHATLAEALVAAGQTVEFAKGLQPVWTKFSDLWTTPKGPLVMTSIQSTTELLKSGPDTNLLQGRLPTSSSEVLVNQAAHANLKIGVGDLLSRAAYSSDHNVGLKVVGILQTSDMSETAAVVAIDNAFAAKANNPEDYFTVNYFQLTGGSPTWAEVQRMNDEGITVLSRSVVINPPSLEQQPEAVAANPYGYSKDSAGHIVALNGPNLLSLGYLYLLVLVLPVSAIAYAAFAFRARRLEHTFALLQVSGASRGTIRYISVFTGVLLSLLGWMIGVVAGLLAALVIGPAVANGNWNHWVGLHVPLGQIAAFALMACVIGVVISLVPAVRSTKLDLISVLKQRTKVKSINRKSIWMGIALLALGAGLILLGLFAFRGHDAFNLFTLFFNLGAGSAALGIMILGVPLVWLAAKTAGFLSRATGSLALRLAAHSMKFNLRRFSPAVVAIALLGVAGTLLAAGLFQTAKRSEGYAYQPEPSGVTLIDIRSSMTLTSPNSWTTTNISSGAKEFSGAASWWKVRANESIARAHSASSQLGSVDPISVLQFDDKTGDGSLPGSLSVARHPEQFAFLERHVSAQMPQVGVSAYPSTIAVMTGAQLRALLGPSETETTIDALNAGEMIVFESNCVSSDGRASLNWYPLEAQENSTTTKILGPTSKNVFKARYAQNFHGTQALITAVVSPTVAKTLGASVLPAFVAADTSKMAVNSLELSKFYSAMMAAGLAATYPQPDTLTAMQIAQISSLVLIAFLYLVALITLAFTRFEGRNNDRALARVGVKASAIAWGAAASAGMVTLSATGFGVLGAGAFYAAIDAAYFRNLRGAMTFPNAFEGLPWALAIALVVVPAAMVAITFRLTAPRHPERTPKVAIE